MLLVLTLSLSAFTASLAGTLDDHLYDQTYYEVGADMRMDDLGQSTEATAGPMGSPAEPAGGNAAATEAAGPRWLFLPVSEYLQAPGVNAATRVGRYGASTRLGGRSQEGTFMGVDRVDFTQGRLLAG